MDDHRHDPAGRVTRDVAPGELRDLLEQPARAALAFVDSGEVELVPARARWAGEAHGFCVRDADAPDLDGREVVLTRDDGAYWFELRAVLVRGVARRETAPKGEERSGLAWYSVAARRVVAWDYATLRSA